jgi:Domain of unknown function (DUF4234)
MAEEVVIRGTSHIAKRRIPLGVIGLTLITLGIYGFVWYYKINNEMNALGQANGDEYLQNSPGTALLAVTLGILIIVPPFVSFWRTNKRIERSQERVLGSNNFSPVLSFVLTLIGLGFISTYLMQSNLNQVWERQ